jgi:hypothetical protein
MQHKFKKLTLGFKSHRYKIKPLSVILDYLINVINKARLRLPNPHYLNGNTLTRFSSKPILKSIFSTNLLNAMFQKLGGHFGVH